MTVQQNRESIITASGLGKQVETASGALTILKGIDLEIAGGESVAIVGASGSGKSTLIGLLAGLDLATEGDISLDGQSLAALDEDGRAALRSNRVGFVFQSFQLIDSLTAMENVMLPLELAGNPDPAAEAAQWLQRVGLTSRVNHYPNQLSGGEQQRVAIARAFASHPQILFADEPTGNLDTATGHHIIELLFELNRQVGTTLVLVTHDPALAGQCDRFIELEGGQLLRQGTNK
ncbi:MAG: ABC transporter ATP-binding protein [Gammaproteobacteria bacterium]|nr:ABC transporter ATP-binding protein [Gammaproteobacteria bacterium]